MDKNTFKKIALLIDSEKIAFDFPDRQRLLGYINMLFSHSDIEERIEIILQVLGRSGNFDSENMDNHLAVKLDSTDYRIYYLLKRYGIDVNDFGITMDFRSDAITEEPQAAIIEATLSSEKLIDKYIDYKPQFILFPIIFKNGVNILGAERGTGKTRFAISLAYAIAYCMVEFLGYLIQSHGGVLFLNFEIMEPEFKLFIDPIANFYRKFKVGNVHPINTISFPSHRELKISDIDEAIQKYKPLLLVIDSFKAFATRAMRELNLRELTNLNVNLLYDYFEKWRRVNNTTVLILNHTNKGTKKEKSHSDLMFGPSGLMDYCDHTMLMRKTDLPNQRLIIPDKSRFSAESSVGINLIELVSNSEDNKLWFELITSDVNEDDYRYTGKENKHNDEQKDEAIRLSGEGKSLREISSIIGIPKSTVEYWINQNKKL